MSNSSVKFAHDPKLISKVRGLWWTIMFILVLSLGAAALPLFF